MINISIPGFKDICIRNIVFDYNGTLAEDGKVSDRTMEMLLILKEHLNVYVATADTYGNVAAEFAGTDIEIRKFPSNRASLFKKETVISLGPCETMCVGNGVNDIEMSKECILSVAVIGPEGCSGKLISNCDIAVKSVDDVFHMLNKTDRIKATLRG